MKLVLTIDGNDFDTLEGFFDVVSRDVIPGVSWGRNLNAFNDILRGGFGTPDEGFVLRWVNSARSVERLGYPETVRQLQQGLESCYPRNFSILENELAMAESGVGPTIFDWLVEIIHRHGEDGDEAEDGVELLLE
ncbi:MAG: barstar family protein [Verrucomicrobiota bacterium JB022]|nr:barstar family protein [Verrucomicrobiota bacterium JB022]